MGSKHRITSRMDKTHRKLVEQEIYIRLNTNILAATKPLKYIRIAHKFVTIFVKIRHIAKSASVYLYKYILRISLSKCHFPILKF